MGGRQIETQEEYFQTSSNGWSSEEKETTTSTRDFWSTFSVFIHLYFEFWGRRGGRWSFRTTGTYWFYHIVWLCLEKKKKRRTRTFCLDDQPRTVVFDKIEVTFYQNPIFFTFSKLRFKNFTFLRKILKLQCNIFWKIFIFIVHDKLLKISSWLGKHVGRTFRYEFLLRTSRLSWIDDYNKTGNFKKFNFLKMVFGMSSYWDEFLY